MEVIDYNQLWEFSEFYPTAEDFTTFVTSVQQVAPLFNVTELYNAMITSYKGTGLKHSTLEDFNADFAVIYNKNIFRMNREFELISSDYDFTKAEVTTKSGTDSIDRDITVDDLETLTDTINRDVTVTDYEKPQFANLSQDPTNNEITDETTGRSSSKNYDSQQQDNQTTTYDSVVTLEKLTTNEQLDMYFEMYRRFNLYDWVEVFSPLFLEVFVIR